MPRARSDAGRDGSGPERQLGLAVAALVVGTLAVATLAVGALTLDAPEPGQSQSGDRFEPNDDFATAATPERGTYRNLSVVDGESDLYRVHLDADQPLVVTASFAHDDGDLDLQLYDGNRTLVADSTSTTDNERIEFRARASGTYYLRVWGFGGASSTYDLTLSSESPIQPEDDGGILDSLPLVLGIAAIVGVLAAIGYVALGRR